jgi:CBS domain-containing protein
MFNFAVQGALQPCFPETSLRLAAGVMLDEGFSSLPVIAKDQKLLYFAPR